MTVAVASLWSFEMLVYTWTTYLGLVCYEEYFRTDKITNVFKNIFKRVLSVIVLAMLVYGCFIMDAYRREGRWPDWGHYLNFVFLVTHGQWNAMTIAPWSPWFIILVIIWGSAL